MIESPYKGLRAVPWLRTSTEWQADTSLPAQMGEIEPYAEREGIVLLDPHLMPGVSASIRTNSEVAVQAIIDRKLAGEPIDAIIVRDISRFTRSGTYHCGKLMTMLEEAEIILIDIRAGGVDHELTPAFRMLQSSQDQQFARSNAFNSASGSRQSLEDGRRTYCTRPPYGIDRLYLNSEGRPLYLMRDLGHRVRVKLDPATGDELHRYGPSDRFKKEKHERVVLVPGADDRVEVVRRIYRLHFLSRKGGHAIARILNDDGIPAPNGEEWCNSTVLSLLKTTAFVGYGYASMYSKGVYAMQASKSPLKVTGKQGHVVRQIRPREDWYRVECEELANYLPEDVRARAIDFQQEHLDNRAGGKRLPNKPTKPGSKRTSVGWKCLLSGILKESNTGKDMRGTTASKGKHEYYRLARGNSAPSSKTTYANKLIPMRPLDREVLNHIEAILCGIEDLRPMLVEEIRSQDQARRGDPREIERLHKEREALKVKAAALYEAVEGPFADTVRSKLDALGERKVAIDDRLVEIDAGPQLTEAEIERMADGILADLHQLLDELHVERDASLRHVCEVLIDSAIADVEARTVKVSFAVPASMLSRLDVCPAKSRGSEPTRRTNKWQPVCLGTLSVHLPKGCRGSCWDPWKPMGCSGCHRRRNAA